MADGTDRERLCPATLRHSDVDSGRHIAAGREPRITCARRLFADGPTPFYRIRRSNWATSKPVSRKNFRLSSRALNPSSNAAIVPLTGLSK
jgi:hypothetical protein